MSKSKIAIIYEGEKTERLIFNSLISNFWGIHNEVVVIDFPAGQNIYMLWKKLKTDNYDTDIIEVLREYNKTAKEKLEGYKRDDFSEVYLFFDYDGQAYQNGDSIIQEMLAVFQDETELGKLYISYPMAEALRDISKNTCSYGRCMVTAHENIRYKHLVKDMNDFSDYKSLSKDAWKFICKMTINKGNCLINMKKEFPTYEQFIRKFGQDQIFMKQMERYIPHNKIAVLSAFPFFILEYYKKSVWNNMLDLEN